MEFLCPIEYHAKVEGISFLRFDDLDGLDGFDSHHGDDEGSEGEREDERAVFKRDLRLECEKIKVKHNVRRCEAFERFNQNVVCQINKEIISRC